MMTEPEAATTLMPDSLDLVKHARLGLNGLTGTVDPDLGYEPFFMGFFNIRPAYMVHWSTMVSGVLPKYLEALPLLRRMTGSSTGADIEKGIVQSILDNTAEDGLIYDRVNPRRPWNVGIGYGKKSWNEDYSNLGGDGRLLCGMDFYAQLTGDPLWEKQMKRTAERMMELAVVKGDIAYYPHVGLGNDFSYPRTSGWVHTNEPMSSQEGAEGATTFCQSQPVRGWIRWYKRSGDERFLELSRKFTHFYTLPKFWGGVVEQEPAFGSSRAHFWGHFHGNLGTLRGAFEYALAADDYRLKSFVRDGYEWAWHNLQPRLGLDVLTESCTYADLTALGIQLSLEGVGDFWDQVDVVVRNALSQAQLRDMDALRKVGEAGPERPKDSPWGSPQDGRFINCQYQESMTGMETADRVLERSIGSFAFSLTNGRYQSPFSMQCCTANGNQAFYYAWEAVVKGSGNTATVNLLFNRFSPWLDLESYLPYEGKIIIHNKKARNLQVRIPGWVKLSELRCFINDLPVTPVWNGRLAGFYDIPTQAKVQLEFPIQEETTTLMLPDKNSRQYRGVARGTYRFKGSTCIGILEEENIFGSDYPWVKIYQKPEYALDQAPMVEVPYQVVDNPIRWY
jgi:hypothetical protein